MERDGDRQVEDVVGQVAGVDDAAVGQDELIEAEGAAGGDELAAGIDRDLVE